MAAPDVSVVLPAWNSAAYIADSVHQLLRWYDEAGLSGEVIVVNDGSTDGTSEAVPQVEGVRVIRLARNRGKGSAVRAGMLEARGKVRIFTDAELPYGTEPMARAARAIREGNFHAVVGDRTLPGSTYSQERLLRRAVSTAGGLVLRTLVTGGFYDTQCGLKAFRADVAQGLFAVTRVDRFAADVEMIYLLLKYHLRILRVRVCLRSQVPSTVRLFRDSVQAFADVLRIPWNWHRGLYRSEALETILLQDLAREEEGAYRASGTGSEPHIGDASEGSRE